MRTIGTVARGVRAPIIREGDNIAEVAAASVMEAWKEAGIEPHDRDVVAITESVVARAQGNYATLDQIAKDVREKTGGGTVGVALHNDSSEERTVRHGDRVAQLVLLPFLPMEFEEVDELPATVRGEGGFGSTGR